ncbi:MAG: TetR/AcrR family transcriptional regulator [Pseudomonadota bacterium]
MIEAARQLLVEHGPRGVTVDAVSERSGVAKSTMYRHFASRTELMAELVRSCMPDLPLPDVSAGFEACLRAHVGDVVEALSEDSYALTIGALVTLRRQMPELEATVEAERADKLAVLDAIVLLGRTEGRIDDSIDAERLTSLVLGPLVFEATFARSPHTSSDEHAAHMRELADDVVDRFLVSLSR